MFRSNSRKMQVVLAVAAIVLAGCHPGGSSPSPTSAYASMSDVDVAKSIFKALSVGDTTVQGDIDWEGFSASGMDIGATYRAFKDEPNKSAFRTSFITNYSAAFKKSGASADMLTNWTQSTSDSNSSVVTAENVNHRHLKLTLSKKDGSRKLSAIDVAM